MPDNDGAVPECMQENTQLITGPCPKCGGELEFFSITELRNASHCYLCKAKFDPKEFAQKLGLSI
ncbi:MAG: hypothetical protein LBV23_05830 [Deltaproteobacteria bacterium]|jgi:hypothetical protein|nr:hypothetical protein [Deltaproteobacteria bacterium]